MRVSFYRFDGLKTSTTTDIPGNVPARIKTLIQFAKELPRALSTLRQGGDWHQSYVEEWRHFVASVRTGRRVECGLEDGRRALAIALAAVESAATGNMISVRGEKQALSELSGMSTLRACP
jgi:predicted dehydrogenase